METNWEHEDKTNYVEDLDEEISDSEDGVLRTEEERMQEEFEYRMQDITLSAQAYKDEMARLDKRIKFVTRAAVVLKVLGTAGVATLLVYSIATLNVVGVAMVFLMAITYLYKFFDESSIDYLAELHERQFNYQRHILNSQTVKSAFAPYLDEPHDI